MALANDSSDPERRRGDASWQESDQGLGSKTGKTFSHPDRLNNWCIESFQIRQCVCAS